MALTKTAKKHVMDATEKIYKHKIPDEWKDGKKSDPKEIKKGIQVAMANALETSTKATKNIIRRMTNKGRGKKGKGLDKSGENLVTLKSCKRFANEEDIKNPSNSYYDGCATAMRTLIKFGAPRENKKIHDDLKKKIFVQ